MKKKFEVRRTEGQVKKHISQMSERELAFLQKKLGKIQNITKSFHLQENAETKDISVEEFKNVLRDRNNYSIIEFNRTEKNGRVSRRVLVRGTKATTGYFMQGHRYLAYGENVLCFVIDIDSGRIITAYYNGKRDNHYSVDMSRYDEKLVIC